MKTLNKYKLFNLFMIFVASFSLIFLCACSQKEEVEEIEITDFTYGAPDYGYFTSEDKYNYLGRENNSIVFESENKDTIIQLTDLTTIIKDDEGNISDFLTINEKQSVYKNILKEFDNANYNVTSTNKSTSIIKLVDSELLTKYSEKYPEVSENIKDFTVYIVLSDEMKMMTIISDSNNAYELARSFKTNAENYEAIDLETLIEGISISNFDENSITIDEVVVKTDK